MNYRGNTNMVEVCQGPHWKLLQALDEVTFIGENRVKTKHFPLRP
jgi:hypothetical protein